MHLLHTALLDEIVRASGKPTSQTFLDAYLGTTHPRYPISAPAVRMLAKDFMKAHSGLDSTGITSLLTSLIEGRSGTEKMLAGILLDYAKADQCDFDPRIFDQWLNHLEGWAEVDALCTGKYQQKFLVTKWKQWEPLLTRFSKATNIHKRRASLVLLTSAVSHSEDPRLLRTGLSNIARLAQEKEILITKAISWLLRSMTKHHRKAVVEFLKAEGNNLPAIALRETRIKLATGKKSGQ
jgi:3-methyladenine DNA glycosylase AlkD